MSEPQQNIQPTLYEPFDGARHMHGYYRPSWDMVGYVYIYTAHTMILVLFILWVSTRQTVGLKGYIYTARWGKQHT